MGLKVSRVTVTGVSGKNETVVGRRGMKPKMNWRDGSAVNRACTALVEDLSSISGIHFRKLINTYNMSTTVGSNTLSWSLYSGAHTHTQRGGGRIKK